MTTTVVLFNGEVYKEIEKETYEWASKREFSRFSIVFEGTLSEFAAEKSKKHATKVAVFEEVGYNSYELVWAEKPIHPEPEQEIESSNAVETVETVETNAIEEIDLKKQVLMFQVSLNGWSDSRRRSGKGRLSFEGIKRITDCRDWAMNTFIHDVDEDGDTLPVNERRLVDGSGNELMNVEELQLALNTGIGRFDFDGNYDTVYTTYLEDLDEDEYFALNADMKRVYLSLMFGFDEKKLEKIDDDNLNDLFDGNSKVFEWRYEEAIEAEA